jgi:NAD dependent epimerase/dehydratase family
VNEEKKVIQSPERCSIKNVEELEDMLSEPTEKVIHAMGDLKGDLVVLGIGGKMGPTLARMAKRASELAGVTRRVIGVSRFSASSKLEERLHSWGVETYRGDLLDAKSYAQLPDAPNIVFMAGMKFGSTGQEPLTWAMNVFVPGLVSERYRNSRIAVFSTGNVYGLCPVSSGGSVEGDALHPVGEYALSCLGRERIFEHFSRANQTRMSIIRLNYAVELRYGVLLDIAQRVFSGHAIPLEMGHLNAIWQADAAAMSLRSLSYASTPPFVINITGPEVLSVARIAGQFGELFHKSVRLEGTESEDALLNNAGNAFQLFGVPQTRIDQILSWIADWVARGGETLEKPTHFENRSGDF